MGAAQEIYKAIKDSISVKEKLLDASYVETILSIADTVYKSLKDGNKLLICGNGGSAADAQHAAAELVTRYKINRHPMAAIALTTDTSILTSAANDFSYDTVFRKQVEALGRKGDVLIGISTSGKSSNVLEALKAAKKIGMATVGFTGEKKGPLSALADLTLEVPSAEVARIQEAHILCLHIICDLIERRFYGDLNGAS